MLHPFHDEPAVGLGIDAEALVGSVSDIGQQNSAASFARAVLESSPNIIFIYSLARQQYVYVTPQVMPVLGYSADEVVAGGANFLPDIIHPEDTSLLADKIARLRMAADGQVVESEYRVRHRDGSLRWLHCRNVPFTRSADGAVDEFLGTAADVTERKNTEQALRASEQRYRGVVENQTELICHYLPDTTITFVNEAYERYFGRSREQLVGSRFIDLIPQSGRAQALEHVRLILAAAGEPISMEHEVVRGDGQVRWQQWIDRAVLDADRRVIELLGIGRDITERKQAENALHDALHELHALKDRLQAENSYLQQELAATTDPAETICRSDLMHAVMGQVRRVAATATTVLMLGETGTGKEVIARALHQMSDRKDRPLVRVNCAALPDHLIESELFGHERGAFTGATNRRVGRFELADEGTLFLDEIGDLRLDLQAKLLRVLQEGEFERLGGSKTCKVNVRLIAATNRDLAMAVRDGTFRADLYYRLNVFPIVVPPLRMRRDDIVPLAVQFVSEAARKLGRAFEPMTRSMADALMGHDWPGNVRELQNVIERAAVSSVGNALRLPPDWQGPPTQAHEPAASGLNASDALAPLATLGEMEAVHIRAVLNHTRGRIEGPRGAAAILGLHPSTLRFRIKKLKVETLSPSSPPAVETVRDLIPQPATEPQPAEGYADADALRRARRAAAHKQSSHARNSRLVLLATMRR